MIVHYGLLIILLCSIASCSSVNKPITTPTGFAAAASMAAATLAILQTDAAGEVQLFQSTAIPAFPATNTAILTPTYTPTLTPTLTDPPPTPTPVPCDRVEFVSDVTIPDNSEVAAGSIITKTWQIKNAGACTWSSDYAVVFTGGDTMNTPTTISLPGYVNPGQAVDISIKLTAPITPGTYRANYKLRNASNMVFGIGPEDKPFYIQIKVPLATGILLDFLSVAENAQWSSGANGVPDTQLEYAGADDDPNGVVKIKDNVALEDGTTSSKILLTYPKHQENGFISGLYPAIVVQNGNRFRARIGFMPPGGVCTSGKVKFRLNYLDGATLNTLQDWTKICDGSLMTVDVDLSSLKGKSIQFMLAVTASGSYNDDWAIWSSARIEYP